ncbi:MAG: helicase-exonuclease AddAB subunit AddA [Lachnospiraceae bacterium]|nr:helicase-exonuclease AddAB subunit AddA [Lachnospiraceae bacterium]
MAVQFTEKQKQVISLHNRNILVSAAAGSGKTAVLVERIIQMISREENPVDIDRLLVVTFTKAAAAEMRERVSKAISEKLELYPENEHLQRQATLLHNAQITTIDSFCLFLIRNNFNEIGLDPAFRVADEGELKLLEQDVLSTLLEEGFVKADPAFLDLVECYGRSAQSENLAGTISRLYRYASSNPWPEKWLEHLKEQYNVQNVSDLYQTDWMQFLATYTHGILQDCYLQMKESLQYCLESDGPYMYAELLEQETAILEKMAAAEDVKACFHVMEYEFTGRMPSKKDDSVSAEKRNMVKDIRDRVKKQVKKLKEAFYANTPEQIVEQCQQTADQVNALVDLTLSFAKAMQTAKREQNLLDFSDMEHLALQILVAETDETGTRLIPSKAALDYRDYFEELLIDEYQDSNLVQEYILKVISRENEGTEGLPNNRFMVGDVKQSIYRFRLARPELFMDKFNHYSLEAGENQRIDLDQNFRSRSQVLDGVNLVFKQIMKPEIGGVLYDEAASLKHGLTDADNHSDNAMELLLIGKNDQEDREREASAIAVRIRELLEYYQVTDKNTGLPRKASYGDIVILLRSTTGYAEDYQKVLEEHGIPAYITSRTGYFSAQEVQTLLQLLRVLNNPLQDIPFFGVLKSYFGGFTDEEIARIRSASGESRKQKLYLAVRDYGENGTKTGEEQETEQETEQEISVLQTKCRNFISWLEGYRDMTAYLSVRELLRKLLMDTGYLYYVSAMPSGLKRKANVEMLLSKAAAFEQTSFFGVHHFVRYIEQLEKYDVDYGEANILDENADIVRIMSIHKSKGLEFPICFVSSLAKAFNKMDSRENVVVDMDLGVGINAIDCMKRTRQKTVRKNVLARKLELDSLGEELRVLYVAMTRAREKLILTGLADEPTELLEAVKNVRTGSDGTLSYSYIAGAASYLDLVLPAVFMYQDLEDVSLQVVAADDITTAEYRQAVSRELQKRRVEQLEEADPLKEKLLEERFAYQYPHENLAGLYTKTTVSELKMAAMEQAAIKAEETEAFHAFEEAETAPYLPHFAREEENVSGTTRGTAFHRILELLDLEKVDPEKSDSEKMLKDQLDQLAASGRITEETKELVSTDKLMIFLRSDLAKRMQAAMKKKKLYREQPFVMGIPAKRVKAEAPEGEILLIQGIIDVYFEEEDGLVVADYKTDRVKSAVELVKRYETQLDYYGDALTQLTGKKVKEKIIYSFALGTEITVGK